MSTKGKQRFLYHEALEEGFKKFVRENFVGWAFFEDKNFDPLNILNEAAFLTISIYNNSNSLVFSVP